MRSFSINRFLDSVYFVIVSISTVGFGDIPWKSQKCYNKSIFILILTIATVIFAMGTFASTITEINLLITAHHKKKAKRSVVAPLSPTLFKADTTL